MRIIVATVLLSALAACTAPPRGAPPPLASAQAPECVSTPAAGSRDDSVVASIPLAHAQAEQVMHDLRTLMNGWTHCRFVANEASQTIVVVGPVAEIEALRAVVAQLDTPQKQVVPTSGR